MFAFWLNTFRLQVPHLFWSNVRSQLRTVQFMSFLYYTAENKVFSEEKLWRLILYMLRRCLERKQWGNFLMPSVCKCTIAPIWFKKKLILGTGVSVHYSVLTPSQPSIFFTKRLLILILRTPPWPFFQSPLFCIIFSDFVSDTKYHHGSGNLPPRLIGGNLVAYF